MKKLRNILILTALILSLPVFSNTDISKLTAARVRFALGHPQCSFRGKSYDVGFDYLVLLGTTYKTGDGKLEIVDFNNSTYWFDKDTSFHFESIDIGGNKTTLYFGKGKAVIETKKPVILSVASASLLLPEKGTYLVMRDLEGKDRVYITAISGEKPVFVKKNKVFSRIHINKKSDKELLEWVKRRKHDWALTKSRMLANSMVNKMPPYIAYTDETGKTRWYKVAYVKPIYRINNLVKDNWFIFDPVLIHAYGLLSPSTIYMTDYELYLWFATNRYNSIKWAWDPFRGWHAEFYYDPLAGYSAQYGFSPSYLAWYADLYRYYVMAGLDIRDRIIAENHPRRGAIIMKPVRKPATRVFRHIKTPVAVNARLNTDPVIREARVAAKVGLRERDFRRIDYYSDGGSMRRSVRERAVISSVGRNSYGSVVGRPIYTIKPIRVITPTTTSRKSAVK